MKKILTKLLSAAISCSMLLSSTVAVHAEDTAVTLSDSVPTVINAGDYQALGENWFLAGAGTVNQHLKVNDSAKSATISIPFKVASKQQFKLSVDTLSNSVNSAISNLKFKIDSGDIITIANSNCADGGVGLAGNYGPTSGIRNYNTPFVLAEGDHTITFIIDDQMAGCGYRGTVGNITFTPTVIKTLASEAATVINAGDYQSFGENWALAGAGTVNQHLRVGDSTKSATISIPFKVASKQQFKLSVDTLSHSVNNAISNLQFKIDDGDVITVNNTNCTDGGTGLAANYGASSGIRNYNTPFVLSEGDHTITFIVNDQQSGEGYRGTVGNITFTPVPYVTLSATEATVLDASDYAGYAENFGVQTKATGDKYLKTKNTSVSPSTVTIPFKVSEGSKYKVALDTFSWSAHEGGGAQLWISVDGGDFKELWWKSGETGCTATKTGEGIVTDFGAETPSFILEYNKELSFTEGTHYITFKTTFYGGGTKNQATIGDVTLTPLGADLDGIKAKNYIVDGNGYGIKDGTTLAVTYTSPGTITLPLNVVKKGYYNLEMDLYAKMNNSEALKSWLYYQIDNGEVIKLSEENTTNEGELTAEYTGLGKLHKYVLNKAVLLDEGEHTVTFSVNEACETKDNGRDIYPTAIDTISLKEAKAFTSVAMPYFKDALNVNDNLMLMVFDENNNQIVSSRVAAMTYASSNESVATVNGSGTVTALAGGKTEISVAVRQFEGDTSEFKVTKTLYVYDNGICICNESKATKGMTAQLKTNKAVGNAVVYAAKYGSDNVMTGIDEVYSGALEKNADKTLNAEFTLDLADGEYVKIFVWDGTSTVKPITAVKKCTF